MHEVKLESSEAFALKVDKGFVDGVWLTMESGYGVAVSVDGGRLNLRESQISSPDNGLEAYAQLGLARLQVFGLMVESDYPVFMADTTARLDHLSLHSTGGPAIVGWDSQVRVEHSTISTEAGFGEVAPAISVEGKGHLSVDSSYLRGSNQSSSDSASLRSLQMPVQVSNSVITSFSAPQGVQYGVLVEGPGSALDMFHSAVLLEPTSTNDDFKATHSAAVVVWDGAQSARIESSTLRAGEDDAEHTVLRVYDATVELSDLIVENGAACAFETTAGCLSHTEAETCSNWPTNVCQSATNLIDGGSGLSLNWGDIEPDLFLDDGAPEIDAGNAPTQSVASQHSDINGKSRPWGGAYDIGPIEWRPFGVD